MGFTTVPVDGDLTVLTLDLYHPANRWWLNRPVDSYAAKKIEPSNKKKGEKKTCLKPLT